MSTKWAYQTVEVKQRMMGGVNAEELKAELNRQGQSGWELVNVLVVPMNPPLLVFKRPI